jgi:hypothetical protein
MEEKQETIWSRLAEGKLPSMDVNTNVEIDQNSVFKAATIFFVLVVLTTVAFFVIKKRLA